MHARLTTARRQQEKRQRKAHGKSDTMERCAMFHIIENNGSEKWTNG